MYVVGGCALVLVLFCCMAGIGGAIWYGLRAKEERVGGGTDGSGTVHEVGGTVVVTGVVESVQGLPAVSVGTPCSFTVDQRQMQSELMCHANVMCGGVTVYGTTPDNGYFHCAVFSTSPPAITGYDNDTTATDSDSSFSIDTASGVFRVTDDSTGSLGAFSLSARITSAN